MDYIQTSNKAIDLHGQGAHGFAAGDPSAALVATYLSPEWCNAVQQELMNVITAGGQTPTAGVFNQLLLALQALFGANIRYFPAGVALPTADRGPIWSADFNSIMTWQVFNANGADFAGYASHLVGSLLADTQPTARLGYVASGSLYLPRTGQYAALRAWAMHHGRFVTEGAWSAGRIVCADNSDGTTFRVYDVRGEFPRFWDNSRGVVSQGFGEWLADMLRWHDHPLAMNAVDPHQHETNGNAINSNPGGTSVGNEMSKTETGGELSFVSEPAGGHTPSGSVLGAGGTETRPRSTALLAAIKF